jgi:hypothetical protein
VSAASARNEQLFAQPTHTLKNKLRGDNRPFDKFRKKIEFICKPFSYSFAFSLPHFPVP